VKAVSGDATMSRETDKLMLKLPLADVAEWLRQELEDVEVSLRAGTQMGSMEFHDRYIQKQTLQTLIAKLGH